MTTFTRDVQKVQVKASVDSTGNDFEVSTDGTVKINGTFTVSGAETVGGALTAGSLAVLGGARVSAVASLEGAVVAKSTLTVTATTDVGALLKPDVTIGVSSFNPLVVTRYLKISGIGGVAIYVPAVSVLPS